MKIIVNYYLKLNKGVIKLTKERFFTIIVVTVLLLSTIVYQASAITVQQLFPNYNVVTGTVVNGVYLRGAPCATSTTNPVYFYKINGNTIYIAPSKTVYVLEKDNNYYYIVYLNPNNNKYYTGYVPMADISCSGVSWCNYDVFWAGEVVSSSVDTLYGPGSQTYFEAFGDISNSTSIQSLDLTVLKTVSNYKFIQYRINGELARAWVLSANVNVYGDNGNLADYYAFTYQYKNCIYSERDSNENTVYIVNNSTNLALTVNNTASGTIVTAAPFTASANQEFSIISQSYASTLCKIYSQYADKMIELTDFNVNGTLAKVKAQSDPNKRQEFIFRINDINSPVEYNCIISTRGSGAHSALRLNNSNQLIATDCNNSDAFKWNVRPKLWSGTMNYGDYNNGDMYLEYSMDSIPSASNVSLNMIQRGAEYWNMASPGNKMSLNYNATADNFVVKFVHSSQAVEKYKNAYAYTVSYGNDGITIINTNDCVFVNNYNWIKTEVYIVYNNFNNLSYDDTVKIIAHEFGHAIKFPHTAVANQITSVLNENGTDRYPIFNWSGSFIPATYDTQILDIKNHS